MRTISPGSIIMLALAMLIAGVAAFFIPVAIDGFDDARVGHAQTTDTDAGRTTGGGIVVGNVTLDETLIDTATDHILVITSNLSTDVPVADNISGQILNLTGLTAASTRTITTTYYHNPLASFTLAGTIIKLGPGIIILGFVVAIGVVGFLGVKGITKG